MSESIEENVVSLKTIHVESCMIWAHQHESLFVSIKYELIHFRCFLASSNSKMTLRISDHQIVFFKMQISRDNNEQSTHLKTSFEAFKKKSINKLSILTILIEFI
jgi:hypothetical protein